MLSLAQSAFGDRDDIIITRCGILTSLRQLVRTAEIVAIIPESSTRKSGVLCRSKRLGADELAMR